MKTVVNQVLYELTLRLMLQKIIAYSSAVSPYSRQHGFLHLQLLTHSIYQV